MPLTAQGQHENGEKMVRSQAGGTPHEQGPPQLLELFTARQRNMLAGVRRATSCLPRTLPQ